MNGLVSILSSPYAAFVASTWRLMYGYWTTGSFGVTSIWLRTATPARNAMSSERPGTISSTMAPRVKAGRHVASPAPVTARRAVRSRSATMTAVAARTSVSTRIAFFVEKKPVTSRTWAPLGIEES